MTCRCRLLRTLLAASSVMLLGSSVWAQQSAGQAAARNMANMKFVTFPPLPTCLTGSVQSGDPTKESSIILIKFSGGCSVPWHWHTPTETLMLVSGVGRLEMKDGKPVALRPGGYAMMPSHHVHQFRCSGPCSLYLYSSGAFDTHYVDAQGKQIPPESALKAVKETAATAMK